MYFYTAICLNLNFFLWLKNVKERSEDIYLGHNCFILVKVLKVADAHFSALWRSSSDGAQRSYDCGFKSHVRCNLQGELLYASRSLLWEMVICAQIINLRDRSPG